MTTIMILNITLVFAVTVLNNIFWTKCVRATSRVQPLNAGIYSVLFILSSSVLILQYVGNPWMLIPTAIGAFVGIYVPLLLEARKDSRPARRQRSVHE